MGWRPPCFAYRFPWECRLAIRAAGFGPEADYAILTVSEIHNGGISVVEKNEGPLGCQ